MFGHKIGWPELESEFFRTGTAMEGACLRMADRIFSSSDCSRDWCAREYGIDAANVPTIHTGVDVELFRPLGGSGSEQLTIVFVGNLSLNKGVGVLADAALRLVLEFPSLRVKLLGSPKPDLAESLRGVRPLAACPICLTSSGSSTETTCLGTYRQPTSLLHRRAMKADPGSST